MPDNYRVEAHENGQRLDKYLATQPAVGSRKRARDAIDSAKVSVDGRRVGPEDRALQVKTGMQIQIEWNRPGSARRPSRARLELERRGVRIVHEDADLLVLDKPPGLLTDAATHQQRCQEHTLRSLVTAWLGTLGQQPSVVHRIDRDTSGLVVVARHPRTGEHLRNQFRAHTPRRVYWVLVAGGPAQDRGHFADPMRWDAERLLQCATSSDDPRGVLARASFEVLERIGPADAPLASVLEVVLQTGRRNQIRLHCQLAGFPLWGERLYVDAGGRRLDRDAPRQALHAHRLAFIHPSTGRQVSFESPLPDDLRSVLASLRRGRAQGRP